MRLLPIVGRELREGSRRRGTYWLRVRVAFQAVIIGVAAYFINRVNPSVKLGTVLFWGLAGISMLFCLLAGRRSTADCLSQEKRDGTLGLLFLTDLKGYDVVLGKLAATSVTALYALLAVFPVLAVPLLTGGMTSGEGERMVLVLTNTFFFSIAIGILASAISRDYRTAMAANFLLWLLLVATPVACGIALAAARSWRSVPSFFGYSCPIFSFALSSDSLYAGHPGDFWWSIGVTDGLAWVLVLLACWIVPRTWGDKPPRAPSQWRWKDFGSWISYGNPAHRGVFRKHALDRNAYFWHAARARLKPAHVWLFLVLSGAWWLHCWVKNGHIWLDEVTFVATAVLLNSTFKLWITLEAGHRLGEDRRSGAFELLLATPLTVADILRGQWLALRRQFSTPLAAAIALEIVFIMALRAAHSKEASALIALLLVLPFDLAALIGVTMCAALRFNSQARVTVTAISRILLLPWVVFGILRGTAVALYWLGLISSEPSDQFETAEWLAISLAVDLIFGFEAWWSLRHNFRQLATQSPAPINWRLALRRAAARIGAFAGYIAPARVRVPLIAGLGIVAAVGVVCFTRAIRPVFPPPVLVSITQSNALLRILPGGQGIFLVLPDGSLWRWGKNGTSQTPRAAMPQQIGTNHDWIKAVAQSAHSLGLRADGTIWELEMSEGTNWMTPRKAVYGFNWVDIGAAVEWSIGLKKDGTIWDWTGASPNSTRPRRVGTGSNWTAVYSGSHSYLALRADGTLWAWGRIVGSRNGLAWVNTNIDTPIRLCADTNWTSLTVNGQARNRAGELWDASISLPDPNAAASVVCALVSSNWAADRIESTPIWIGGARIRSDGTLWTATPASASPSVPSASVVWRQLGTRTDWVAVWGLRGTSFGLTSDGVLWAWGYDLGREPAASSRTRIQLVKDLLNGQRVSPMGNTVNLPPPILEEPRPLMKLVSPAPQ